MSPVAANNPPRPSKQALDHKLGGFKLVDVVLETLAERAREELQGQQALTPDIIDFLIRSCSLGGLSRRCPQGRDTTFLALHEKYEFKDPAPWRADVSRDLV